MGKYSPFLSPQEDNSDIYSTWLFGEALEGSNGLPRVVISLIMYTWGSFPCLPCFLFQDPYFSSLEPLPKKVACQHAITQKILFFFFLMVGGGDYLS